SSFRLPGRKVKAVGHGINLKKYFPLKEKAEIKTIQLVTVGRITPIKDYDTLIKALKELKNQGYLFEANIIGAPILQADKEYFEYLKKKTINSGLQKSVIFVGGLAPEKVIPYLQKADIFVHMSQTGSLDKTVLEAMACGLLIVSCNDSTKDVVNKYQDYLLYEQGNQEQLANRIKNLYSLKPEEKAEIKSMLAEIAGQNDLPGLIGKIKQELS
ncbi:MAG: glycosyltransferase family 4 protein, partial [Patescibacteria group bacterium]|nr:glycosyltransferase family 4 protein [Patescibacteria group bacterium]